MLEKCRGKKIAKELVTCDINEIPYSFFEFFFSARDLLWSLHFFRELDQIFKEVLRVMCAGGIFGFTIAGFKQTR